MLALKTSINPARRNSFSLDIKESASHRGWRFLVFIRLCPITLNYRTGSLRLHPSALARQCRPSCEPGFGRLGGADNQIDKAGASRSPVSFLCPVFASNKYDNAVQR